MGRSVRQVCPTGEKTHWQAVLESHTMPSGATVHDEFPPFPQPKKKHFEGILPSCFTSLALREVLCIREISISYDELEPATETTTIAKLHRQLHAKMKTEWTIEWARKPIAGRYAISDRIPPSLARSHAFCTLDRRILGIVTQTRTGHGYFGEYYQTHNTQEPADCPCGAGLQTREHIVFECRTHE